MDLTVFSERLSSLQFDAHISTTDFGKAIGVSRSTAFALLTGQREPTLDTIIRIADFFHCYVDYLVGLEIEHYQLTNPTPCPPFKERIPFICKHFGVTRYRLVQITQIGRTTINNWSRGDTVPSVENLVKMAKVLNCSVDFIIGRE